MPRCLPPMCVYVQRRDWSDVCAVPWIVARSPGPGTSCGGAVVMVSTQNQSVRKKVTTDRCHPLVGPCAPLLQECRGGREMTRRWFFVFFLRQNVFYVYVDVLSRLDASEMHACRGTLNMFLFARQCGVPSCLHVCMYVCTVGCHKI